MRLLTTICFVLLTGCQTSIDYAGMESAEERFNRDQSQRLCAFMSEENMFPDPQLRTLAKAARKGKLQKIDQLVGEGIDANSVGTRNCSVLFWAMQNEAGFRRLLELGADPNIVFDDGGSVLHWAARIENAELLILALEFGGNSNLYAGGKTPIFDAISLTGDVPHSLEVLIRAGANLNALDEYGNTPALQAAGLNRYDIVLILLENGADPSLKNKNGISVYERVEKSNGVFIKGSKHERWLLLVQEKLANLPFEP